MWLYLLAGCVLLAIFLYLRAKPNESVPPCLEHLPVLPEEKAPRDARFDLTAAVAKDHKLARVWAHHRWIVSVLDPELSKQVYNNQATFSKFGSSELYPHSFQGRFLGNNLVTATGQEWRKQRDITNPAFEPNKVSDYLSCFLSKADELLEEVKKIEDTPVPIQRYVSRFALDCLGLSAFDVDFHAMQDENSVYAATFGRIIRELAHPKRMKYPFRLYDFFPTADNRQLGKDIALFNQLLKAVLDARQAQKEARADLASQLLAAQSEHGTMTVEDVRANMVIFFLAGHDTTATALSSAFYHLAANPASQAKLYDELVLNCGKDCSEFDQKQPLEYLTAVIFESTRMAPSVARLRRIATADTELGGCKIPKGTALFIESEQIHHLEREWPNPSQFDPSRFLGENEHNRRSLAWQSFGGGPRMCIGRNFSMLEQKVLLAKFLLKYEVSLVAGDPGRAGVREFGGLNQITSSIVVKRRAV